MIALQFVLLCLMLMLLLSLRIYWYSRPLFIPFCLASAARPAGLPNAPEPHLLLSASKTATLDT